MSIEYALVDERQFGNETPQGNLDPCFKTLKDAASVCHPVTLWGSRSYLVAVEDGWIRRLTAEEDVELRKLAKEKWPRTYSPLTRAGCKQ